MPLLQGSLNQANTVLLLMAAGSLICWTLITNGWWITVHEQASNACLKMRLFQFTLLPCFEPSLPVTPLLMLQALVQCFDLASLVSNSIHPREFTKPLPMAIQEEDDYSSPIEEDTDEDDLSAQILAKYERSQFDPEPKWFLPAGILEDLLTEEAIIKELDGKSRLDPEDLVPQQASEKKKSIVDFVRQNAKRLFAIAVLSGFRDKDLRSAMQIFKKIEFTDERLPVTSESLRKRVSKYPKLWSKMRIYNFNREQWHFLSPVFSPQQTKFSLEPNHVLPFLEKSSGCDVQEGAFSQVFCIKIHPAHQINPVKDVGSL